MFILSTIEDLIQIEPEATGRPSAQAIKDAINTKFSNKIIQKVGLCICLFDILQTSEGLIGHGTGLVNVNVEFRMVVFRPFRGEILYGRIKSSNEEGIVIDVEFFNEISVPYQNLPKPCTFDHAEGVWIWRPDGAELFFDRGESVLFKVEHEEWFDQKPSVQQKDAHGNTITDIGGTAWRIIGSMEQSGLGPTLWWGEGNEETEQGGQEEADEDVDMGEEE
ncbi:DNA-directed rna polymerase III 25 kd polypeptide [Lentithecium fluviatile CBS 122367]|uniref:DNA-directed RNA polymerase subunit n=1 Tax=Lentithecium fluviatile CBS 122367 TaxID=1168545 RepID=A0A6G1IX85_9PLEO|nr:DNA-directed rna polymerase III 25 kd polypeptide [Lentithecium fluviatile CBS 122367]